jgi:hypothetical protein
MNGKRFVLIVGLTIFLSQLISAQLEPTPYHFEPYVVNSEIFKGQGTSQLLAYQNTIQIGGAPWIRIFFDETVLSTNSYLLITSLQDGAQQRLNILSLSQWDNTSAFFNGDGVRIELHVAPQDSGVFFKIDTIMVGNRTDSLNEVTNICGLTDDRTPSSDSAVGRLSPLGGTAWIVSTGSIISAGHCVADNQNQILEFNVPTTTDSGIRHPDPIYQYPINMDSKCFHDNGLGDDWAVFNVYDNSESGKQPIEMQHSYYEVAQSLNPSVFRLTGYGLHQTYDSSQGKSQGDSLSQTQLTSTGPKLESSSDSILNYQVDANYGSSGSPVIDVSSGKVVGVHTSGGCTNNPDSLSANHGTSTNNASFWSAIWAEDTITVDQKLQGGVTTVDSIGHWETTQFVKYKAPTVFQFGLGNNEVLQGTQKIISGQKYNNWSLLPDVTNHHSFYISKNIPNRLVSYLKTTNLGVLIKTELIDAPSVDGGTIGFRDPWLIDYTDASYGNAKRNCGHTDALWYDSLASPFYPDTTIKYNGCKYNGVFLGQNIQDGVYYSVRVESTQIIDGYTAEFAGWQTSGADLAQVGANTPGYHEMAVVFRSSDAVVKAMYHIKLTDSVTSSWNLASVPLNPVNKLKTAIWPTAISDVFAYEGTYIAKDSITEGKGYWVKFLNNQSITYTGAFLDSLAIPVSAGWNMIGSLSSEISTNQVGGDSIIISDYFKYDNGYRSDTIIEPGRGYWIKTNQAGIITLTSSAPFHNHNSTTQNPPDPLEPLKPVLIAPDSGATSQSITLTCSWTNLSNADIYQYQLSTSSSFATLAINDSSLTTNSKTISSLSYSTTYYWRVKAFNYYGPSSWSNVWKFTTTTAPATTPAAPTLVSPTNGATDQETSLYLTWNASTGATAYRAQVSTSSSFASYFSDIQNITGTSVSITGLANSTKYYWRVNASNSAGTSAWSSVRNFTTKSASSDPCPEVSSYAMMDAVIVSDATGSEQTLYLHNGDLALGQDIDPHGDMPPTTPPGVFHAKFKGDKIRHKIKTGKEKSVFPIDVKDATYPLTIKWNLKDINRAEYEITFKDGAGKTHVRMSGIGQTTINDPDNNNSNILITASAIDPCVPEPYRTSHSQMDESSIAIPQEFSLHSNRPNPFNPTTVISYDLPDEFHVVLTVYDVLGREIRTLVNETQSAGTKTVTFDGSSLSSGVYYYRIEATSIAHPGEMYQKVMKMVLTK